MIALVLGGTGFLGSHLVQRAVTEGLRVKVYGRHAPHLPNVEFIYGDVQDRPRLRDALLGVDCVFHLAWSTVPATADEDPMADVQSNLINGLGLLDACREVGNPLVIFTSSGGTVYGAAQHEGPIAETAAQEPICAYGITKLTMEKYLVMYRHLHGLDYRVLRIANAYGEGQQTHRPQGLIGVALQRVATNQPLTVWGGAAAVRDYIYAADIVDCCIKAALTTLPAEAPRIFNVSSGVGYSIKEVLATIESVTGMAVKTTAAPARGCDLDRVVLDNQLARQVLGWSPQTMLPEGIQKTWEWVAATAIEQPPSTAAALR